MVDINFWKGRKVLITGHTGFKGSWLCMLLNHLGSDLYGYALNPPTDPNLFGMCRISEFVKSKIADIRDFNTLSKALEDFKPEIVIHMAAQPLVRLSYSDPVITYDTNVMGTVYLLEAIRQSPSKTTRVLLNITTDKCYDNKEWIWPYRENEPLGGYDPYSSSKACSEIITASYRNSFFNPDVYSKHRVAIATARAGNVIGGGDWAADRLIPDIIRSILKKEPVIIRNPGAIRPWQHVLEPLTGYLMLCERLFNDGAKYSQAWNFGPEAEDSKSVEWMVKRICELVPGASYQISGSCQLHEANYLRLDISKVRNMLGWHPRWNLEKALEMIIEFFFAHGKGQDSRKICENQISNFLAY